MPRVIIAGNWKMYKTRPEAESLLEGILQEVGSVPDERVLVVFPSFPLIAAAAARVAGTRVEVGAQNLYPGREGAWTGEVSARQLADAGATWVLVGHSERRHGFAEGDPLLAEKLRAALDCGLRPILCVGETLEERERKETFVVLARQISGGLARTADRDWSSLTIAYEPVWAIGTGRTATPEQAEEAHGYIRGQLQKEIGSAASAVPLLYGGSVKPDNAADLLARRDVDGVLVGGASLDAGSFLRIARA